MRKRGIIVQLILLAALWGCSGDIIIDEWNEGENEYTMYSGSNERNFYFDFSLGDSLELLRTVEAKGSFLNSTPVFYDTLMFVPDLAGRIYCFSIITGKEEGVQKHDGEIAVSPIINEGKMYYVLNNFNEDICTLFSYDLVKGSEKRQVVLPGRVGNELLLFKDGISILTDFGIAYKFDFKLDKIWETETSQLTYSTPAADNDYIYFGNQAGELISINQNTGRIKYRNKIAEAFEGGVSIRGTDGFIGDIKGNLYSFKTHSGEVIWKFNSGSKIKGIPVYNGNDIYFGNLAGDVFSLDLEQGSLHWKCRTGGIVNVSPALFDDVLLVPDLNKKVHLLDISTGEILTSIEFDERVKQTPVYYRGIIYIGIDRGVVNFFTIALN